MLHVDDGAVERGIAGGLEMHVITALDAEWDAVAQRPQHVVRPRTHRHHCRAGADRSFARQHLPAAPEGAERARIALQKAPATLREQLGWN